MYNIRDAQKMKMSFEKKTPLCRKKEKNNRSKNGVKHMMKR